MRPSAQRWSAIALLVLAFTSVCNAAGVARTIRDTVEDSKNRTGEGLHPLTVTVSAPSNQTEFPTDRVQNYNITMRTLLLSTDGNMSVLPETILNSYGHPLTIVQLVQNGLPSDPNSTFLDTMVDAKGNPQFNAIVVTSLALGYPQDNGTWVSALSPDSWARLRAYCSRYDARFVSLASSYVADPGMQAAPGLENGTSGTALLTFVDNIYTNNMLGIVNRDAVFRVGQVNEFVYTSYWWTPAFVRDGVTNIHPFLYINPVDPMLNPACNASITNSSSPPTTGAQVDCTNATQRNITNPNWVGAFVREIDGREEMHFLINSNQFGHHGLVLGNVWMQWANKDMWLGQRRMHLDTQVDDVLLSTRLYNVEQDRMASESDPAYRASHADYLQLEQYTKDLNARMPTGSRYVPQFAFNGIGYFFSQYDVDSVNSHLHSVRDAFYWVSHTWSHMDLYCYNSNCALYGETQYNDTLFELEKNQWFAETVLYGNVPTDMVNSWPTFSRNGLVTPRISGLNLSSTIQAMLTMDVNNTVGDNSRKDLVPSNFYHSFPSPASDNNNNTADVIPRSATRLYFDCATGEQNTREHASLYGPQCLGWNRTGEVTYPWKCNTTTFKYPRVLTLDELMSIESFEMVRLPLSWRHDPFMFHQANIAFFEHNGRNQSLLSVWVDHVVGYITNYTNAPVLTYKLDDLKQKYAERMERDACGIKGTIEYVDGTPVAVHLTSNATCTAKLSRALVVNGSDPWQLAVSGVEEIYGVDRTRDVPLKAGAHVHLPLGPAPSIAYTPLPTYPLLNSTYTAVLNQYELTMTAERFEMYIVGNITKDEMDLQQLLADELEPVVEMHRPLASVTCRDGGEGDQAIEEVLDEAEKQYHYLSLSAEEARKTDPWPKDVNGSWYLECEERLANTSKQLKADAKEVVEDEEAKTSKAVDGYSSQAIDRLENFGTLYFTKRYTVFLSLRSRYLYALPKCSDGNADPVDELSVVTFSGDGSNVMTATTDPLTGIQTFQYGSGDASGDS